METTPVQKLAYTVDEATQIVPLGRTTIFALIGSGKLRSIKVGGRRLIPASALEELIEGSEAA